MASLVEKIAKFHDMQEFRSHHWSGTFEEYLELVKQNPQITRNAYERIYDMIMGYGREEYIEEAVAYERIGKIARLMLDGGPRTITKGATYYHTRSVNPRWAKHFFKTASVGSHYFYSSKMQLTER